MDEDLKLVGDLDALWENCCRTQNINGANVCAKAAATITRLRAEIEALKSDVSDLVRAGSDEATENERLVKERDEARAGMAYILDHATYGDSYGVHGSDFECCHFCQGGGAPGVALEHTPDCPVSKYPNAVTEWFAEMAENNKDRETAEAQRDAALEALSLLASIWHHGGFVAETRNERLLSDMLTHLGLWPVQNFAASRTLEGVEPFAAPVVGSSGQE